MEILIDNAVQYTNRAGQIHVEARYKNSELCFQISNTGQGIASADIAKVFDRFYRGDKARSSGNGNFGLGLLMAQAAMLKLGGSIGVQSDPELTIFTLLFPDRKLNSLWFMQWNMIFVS